MYNIYFWQTTTGMAAARLPWATVYIKVAAAAMSHCRPEDTKLRYYYYYYCFI